MSHKNTLLLTREQAVSEYIIDAGTINGGLIELGRASVIAAEEFDRLMRAWADAHPSPRVQIRLEQERRYMRGTMSHREWMQYNERYRRVAGWHHEPGLVDLDGYNPPEPQSFEYVYDYNYNFEVGRDGAVVVREIEETQEEKGAREARAKKLDRARAERQEAEAKAKELFLSYLDDYQRRVYDTLQGVPVVSNKGNRFYVDCNPYEGRYVYRLGKDTRITRDAYCLTFETRVTCGENEIGCFASFRKLPEYDLHLAKVLLLQTDEELFIQRANPIRSFLTDFRAENIMFMANDRIGSAL
jgi:hypothetical protein